MLIKSTLLAFATVAALSTTVLTSTTPAEAGLHGNRGGQARMSVGGNRGSVMRGHPGRGHHVRTPGRHFGHKIHRHRHVHLHGRYWRHRHIWYGPRVVYAARPVVYGAAPVITTNRCTCLTKEYTPEGAVLFKDICTNEAAINPPPAPQQTGLYQEPAQQ